MRRIQQIILAIILCLCSSSVFAQELNEPEWEEANRHLYEPYWEKQCSVQGEILKLYRLQKQGDKSIQTKDKIDSLYVIVDSIARIRHGIWLSLSEGLFNRTLDMLLQTDLQDTIRIDKVMRFLSPNGDKKGDYGGFAFFLKKNTDKILPYCWNYKHSYRQRLIMSYLDITDEQKQELLKYDWHGYLSVMARLGDTIAEDSLISCFRNELKEFNKSNVSIHCYRMLWAGTPKCMREYYLAFGCNALKLNRYHEKYSYNYWTALYELVNAYGNVYPNNYFLSDIKISTIVETTRRDDFRLLDYEQQYFREIERYCKDTHGIEIHIDLPFIELNTGNWWYDVENEE